MASKLLPQALIVTPRNPHQCPQKNMSFATRVSGLPSSFKSGARTSVSRVSSFSIGLNLNPMFSVAPKRVFFVRAESNPEAEGETNAEVEVNENVEEKEEVDVEESTQVETEVQSEEAKPPRKPRIKLGDIMGILNTRAVEASEKERPVPDLRTGDIVEIKLEVPENRRRLSVYKGIIISRQNAGIHTTIRIRRIIAGVGVEIVFPIYSPNIKEIKVLKHRKVRRARLYYLRDKLPRLSTFK
ncbi:50S ribosomal protein L19-1, chloroplastic-like [Juglans microcarpa x Juglans regia]|uniref:50S ribosomal protein L19-1, chloroplastic-like n=1 Tax=Juglans microcarpa x Juglans regia TaxID=2249226 RepID=UPI001B7F23EC|nr:50S ribosomal protein L19-1, chloroplastic-like [Juglans microcarpa x Juglans regia]